MEVRLRLGPFLEKLTRRGFDLSGSQSEREERRRLGSLLEQFGPIRSWNGGVGLHSSKKWTGGVSLASF